MFHTCNVAPPLSRVVTPAPSSGRKRNYIDRLSAAILERKSPSETQKPAGKDGRRGESVFGTPPGTVRVGNYVGQAAAGPLHQLARGFVDLARHRHAGERLICITKRINTRVNNERLNEKQTCGPNIDTRCRSEKENTL